MGIIHLEALILAKDAGYSGGSLPLRGFGFTGL